MVYALSLALLAIANALREPLLLEVLQASFVIWELAVKILYGVP